MYSISKPMLKATLGLIEIRNAAEKLGDVTDQQFGNSVVRELRKIKSKLHHDGPSAEDLAASVTSFEQGILFLYQLFEEASSKKSTEEAETTEQSTKTSTDDPLLAYTKAESGDVKQLKHFEIEDMDDSAMKALSDANLSFKAAKLRAKELFSDEEQSISDRLLAMKIRIAAAILETTGGPIDAMEECRRYLKELHAMPDVVESFKIQLNKESKLSLSKEESKDIVCDVCQMNHTILRVTLTEGGNPMFWPYINISDELIDPLRDERVVRILHEQDLNHCHGIWSFGLDGEDRHKLRCPSDLATNAVGDFIVADLHDIKVFTSSGKFLTSLRPADDDKEAEKWFVPISVSTDHDDNVYVLAELKQEKTDVMNKQYDVEWRGIFVFDKHYQLSHKFPINEDFSEGISVTVNSNNHVFVLGECSGNDHVDVHGSDGLFMRSFGQGVFDSALYISAADEGRVMVLDQGHQCIHVFSAEGDHLQQFGVQGDMDGAMAFNRVSKQVCVTSTNRDTEEGQVEIYTDDGQFLNVVQLDTWDNPGLSGAAATVDGRFCLVSGMECKVYVL